MKISKVNILSNFVWRFLERIGAQGISFIVSIVLARILSPDLYGIVALITVFLSIIQVFVDSGLGNALIQKKDADDVDFSTVFYFNVFMCTALYIILYLSAPLISKFYNNIEMIPLIRVIGLTIIISGLKNVQQAYVSRNLLFKKFFFSTIGGTLFSGFIGIVLAYKGFGVWALVFQQLSNTVIDTIILWIVVRWRPKFCFSIKRLCTLFSFGSKLLLSALLDTLYNNIRQLIIGKMYTPSDLAFYNKGRQLPDLIITNVNSSIDSVLLPVMSKEQEHKIIVRNMTRKAIKMSTFIIAPLMIGLMSVSESIVRILLTDKWLACVPFLRIFCITFMFYPIHTANLNAIKAMGRSDIFLKLELCKKAFGLLLLFSVMQHGVMAIAYSLLVSCFVNQIINSWPNKKLLEYSYLEQLKDIFPQILQAIFMGILVYFIKYLNLPTIITLILQVISGVGIYIFLSIVIKNKTFYEILGIIREFKK